MLRESTAFVFPSNEEGFAKSIIEGMASGLPIIATYQSGATTLVEDGVAGIIVAARNVNQIAEAMILRSWHSPAKRMSGWGRAAYERGAKNASWGDFADRLIKICDEAVGKRTRQKNSAQK